MRIAIDTIYIHDPGEKVFNKDMILKVREVSNCGAIKSKRGILLIRIMYRIITKNYVVLIRLVIKD